MVDAMGVRWRFVKCGVSAGRVTGGRIGSVGAEDESEVKQGTYQGRSSREARGTGIVGGEMRDRGSQEAAGGARWRVGVVVGGGGR